jgi:cellulose synthase/poly-beta-1,6-N-acetylglucosamine synthase-like glycosyltransferase
MFSALSVEEILSYVTNNLWECMLAFLLLVVLIYELYFLLRYLRAGAQVTPLAEAAELPGVSVIVCARNEEENLQDYLHNLLTQDYPQYEVIVVDDGSEDQTRMILEQYARQCPKLYHTFVPQGARVLSNKKLALTIGIKAANHDYILLTDADCCPESKYWIREMMTGFTQEQTEVVLGFSPYFEKKGLLNRLISYDTLFNGLQYMGMARAGKPYMGVGRNLAYKRETFFSTGGFKGLLSNRAGDDDLFVNRVATRTNTTVVCNRDSLMWSVPKTTWREWFYQKRRHLSVSPQYRTSSKIRLTLEPLSRGLLYAGVISSFMLGGIEVGCTALALLLLRLLVQIITINIAAHRLGMRRYGIGLVAYDIILPLITLYMLITQPFQKKPLYW